MTKKIDFQSRSKMLIETHVELKNEEKQLDKKIKGVQGKISQLWRKNDDSKSKVESQKNQINEKESIIQSVKNTKEKKAEVRKSVRDIVRFLLATFIVYVPISYFLVGFIFSFVWKIIFQNELISWATIFDLYAVLYIIIVCITYILLFFSRNYVALVMVLLLNTLYIYLGTNPNNLDFSTLSEFRWMKIKSIFSYDISFMYDMENVKALIGLTMVAVAYFTAKVLKSKEIENKLIKEQKSKINTYDDNLKSQKDKIENFKKEITKLELDKVSLEKKHQENKLRLEANDLDYKLNRFKSLYDKDENNKLDLIETTDINLILNKVNTKIEDKEDLEKLLKIEEFLIALSITLSKLFEETLSSKTPKIFKTNIECFKDTKKTYDLSLNSFLVTITHLLKEDRLRYGRLINQFDRMSVFDNKHQKDVKMKLDIVNNNFTTLIENLNSYNKQLSESMVQLENLTIDSAKMLKSHISILGAKMLNQISNVSNSVNDKLSDMEYSIDYVADKIDRKR